MAYAHFASITIDNTKVSGSVDLSSFPVLINGTYDGTGGEPDLRITGSGGNVENEDTTGGVSGSLSVPADFVFSASTDGSAPYDHEVVFWDKATGEIIVYVEVPTVQYDTDTVFYMVYGDSGVTTSQEDVSGTWNSSYALVSHTSGSSTTNLDSTTNSRTLTKKAATEPAEADGHIYKAQDFDGTNDYLRSAYTGDDIDKDGMVVESIIQPNRANMDDAGAILFDKADLSTGGNDSWYAIFDDRNSASRTNAIVIAFERPPGTGSDNALYIENSFFAADSPVHVAFRFDSTATNVIQVWRNGTEVLGDTQSDGAGTGHTNGGEALGVGSRSSTDSSFVFDGEIEAIKFSSAGRSDGWIVTSYNSHFDWTNFYSVGGEDVSAGGGGGLVLPRFSFRGFRSPTF